MCSNDDGLLVTKVKVSFELSAEVTHIGNHAYLNIFSQNQFGQFKSNFI